MASCTRIENSLQAHIDGELGDSERVILEQHVAECPHCARLFREHQWFTAMIFEALSADRLAHPLRQKVLDHLPEMEVPEHEIEELNWRAKHPDKWTYRMSQFVPVAAVVILVFLTIVLRFSYPENSPYLDLYRPERPAVGVVTQVQGQPTRIALDETRRMPATVMAIARPGDRFETGEGMRMMLALAGPTRVKLDENTRIKVTDARRVSVENGAIWLDVAQTGSLFKVITPAGLVTVFGTVFSVQVKDGRMTVTVEEGLVQVESGDHLYQLHDNQQVSVSLDGPPIGPTEVDAAAIHRWASGINPEDRAEALFLRLVEGKDQSTELSGRVAFVIDTHQQGRASEVDAIRIFWDPADVTSDEVSYGISISDGSGALIREDRLDASAFSRIEGYYDVILTEPIRDVSTLIVRLVPDQSTGGRQINSFGVNARTKVERFQIQ